MPALTKITASMGGWTWDICSEQDVFKKKKQRNVRYLGHYFRHSLTVCTIGADCLPKSCKHNIL